MFLNIENDFSFLLIIVKKFRRSYKPSKSLGYYKEPTHPTLDHALCTPKTDQGDQRINSTYCREPVHEL
jgi:hypothetical protein